MQRAIVLAFLLGLSVGASGTACSAGYKHKAKLAGLTCDAAKTDAASCNTNCCELNDKTCGGLAASIACDANSYKDSDVWAANKATQATKDAWLNTAASSKNMNTVCCTARPTCASSLYSCPAGKKKASGVTTKCTSDAKSCAATAGCCVANTATCGGFAAPTCVTGKSLAATTNDAWKATAATNANKNTNCCGQVATCGSKFYSCPAGWKKKTGVATTSCAANPGSLDAATCGTSGLCCEKNTNTCEGNGGIACAADKYYPDHLKNSPATSTNKNTNCCATKATCAVAACPAGWKPKASAAGLSCPKDAASCVPATCCEKDVTKCGGLTAISCPTGFYDENQAWPAKTKQATKDAWANKPATDATKNTACCTAKAVCAAPATTAAPGAVTTTPAAAAAAAVTTTPAAPALKYSEHKVAIEKGSDHPWTTNMALLGVGGLIGMSVLMAAQGLRSRMQAAPTEMKADAREVDNLLLDNENVE